MLRMAASRLLSSGAGCCATGTPRCTTRNSKGMLFAMFSAVSISCSVAFRASLSRTAVEKVRCARPFANTSVIGAWTECRSSLASREPTLQRSNRGRVVIVEVASRGEHLDGFKSVRRNLEQMRLLQPLFVIQVGRHSKPFHDAFPKS